MNAERKQFFMNPLSPSIPKQLGKMEDNFVDKLKKREARWERKWNLAFGGKELANTPSGELTMEKTSFGVYTTYNTLSDKVTSSGGFWTELEKAEREEQLKDLAARHSVDNIQERQGKQSKKTPVEAQKIWKELVHEERLNKRLRIERQKLISVLSQILEKKKSLLIESTTEPEVESPAPTEIAAPPPPIAKPPEKEIRIPPGKPKRLDEIKKKVIKHPVRTIAGVIGAGIVVAAIIFAARSCDSGRSPGLETTPSAATGTPTPTPTQEPTETPAPEPTPILTSTPKPTETPSPTETSKPTATEEVVKAPNLGVKFDPKKDQCEVVDRNTGKSVDMSAALFIERISYRATGVGVTKDITVKVQNGQTAIVQGWKVDGEGEGVFKAVIAKKETTATFNISDGAVEVVGNQDAPLVFCRSVRIAAEKGYAHQIVKIPEAWKIN